MTEDPFLERLRRDAALLQYRPADDFALQRLSARIRERIVQPTVTDILARWLRPIAASVSIVVVAGSIALGLFERQSESLTIDEPIEISMAGDTFRVSE
jgi:hypothetical protein